MSDEISDGAVAPGETFDEMIDEAVALGTNVAEAFPGTLGFAAGGVVAGLASVPFGIAGAMETVGEAATDAAEWVGDAVSDSWSGDDQS